MSLIFCGILLSALAVLTISLMSKGAKFSFALVGSLLQINWAFVGLFIWIVALSISWLAFFVSVTNYLLTQQSYAHAYEMLEEARTFWISGFRDIYKVVTGPPMTEKTPPIGEGCGITVFVACLSVVFWGGIVFLIVTVF